MTVGATTALDCTAESPCRCCEGKKVRDSGRVHVVMLGSGVGVGLESIGSPAYQPGTDVHERIPVQMPKCSSIRAFSGTAGYYSIVSIVGGAAYSFFDETIIGDSSTRKFNDISRGYGLGVDLASFGVGMARADGGRRPCDD